MSPRLSKALATAKGRAAHGLRLLRSLSSQHPTFANSSEQADWYWTKAHEGYQSLDADLSLSNFQKYLELRPHDWFGWHQLSHVHLQLLGDLQGALRLLRYARRLRERLNTPASGKLPYRFLGPTWARQIGHIANMEHLIKRELLCGRDPKNLVLHLPENTEPGNQALLDKLAAYITVVRHAEDLPHPMETMHSVMEEYYMCESIDGQTKHWWHASPQIFRAWEEAGRRPLLTLSSEEMERGRKVLGKLGVPPDAWFACLHVRENRFKADQGYTKVETGLNADIETYLPAIRAVVAQGGRVIRMGDHSMRPAPLAPGFVDYAHSSLKSEWMDVFLLGACRFYIGTSSGPAYVPPLFGIPCVLTNWYPTGSRPFNSRDVFIPKLYRGGQPQRDYSFAEFMAPPIGYALNYVHADRLNLSLVPNTPEEIREVVDEMLQRLAGTFSYSTLDETLQSTFDAVAETNLCIGNARIGARFLQQHAHLL